MIVSGNIRSACRSANESSTNPYAWVSVALSIARLALFYRDREPSRRGFSIAWPRNLRHGPVKSQQRYMGPQHRVIRLCQAISTVTRVNRTPARDIDGAFDRAKVHVTATAKIAAISTRWLHAASIGERGCGVLLRR